MDEISSRSWVVTNVVEVPHGYIRKEGEFPLGHFAGHCEVIFHRAEAIGEGAECQWCAAQSSSPVENAICKCLILGFINRADKMTPPCDQRCDSMAKPALRCPAYWGCSHPVALNFIYERDEQSEFCF